MTIFLGLVKLFSLLFLLDWVFLNLTLYKKSSLRELESLSKETKNTAGKIFFRVVVLPATVSLSVRETVKNKKASH